MSKIHQNPATTYHLVPAAVWEAVGTASEYLPDAFAADGFIHCTDDAAELIAVGNRYYRADARPYLAVVISRKRLRSPVKYEDPGRKFPHIYGALNTDAVERVVPIVRDCDGTFVALGGE